MELIGRLYSWPYRWRCPRTVEAAAEDFIKNQNPQCVLDFLVSLPEAELATDTTLDFRRRIAMIYGLADSFGDPMQDIWVPGFNRKLLDSCGETEPYKASLCILHEVYRQLKQS